MQTVDIKANLTVEGPDPVGYIEIRLGDSVYDDRYTYLNPTEARLLLETLATMLQETFK